MVMFEELDWRSTRLGEISLRRRWDPTFDKEVYEVKLDDDFLMSSLFTVAEIELTELALAELQGDELQGAGLDVVVGGLGLGYTAQAVLDSPKAGSLLIVEALAEVIEWHQSGLIPAGKTLSADPRCRYVNGDFFAMAASEEGFDPDRPGRKFHSIILDVDHSPRHVLHPSHQAFYDAAGTAKLAGHLHPGGIFALWSNDPPDDDYLAVLSGAFTDVRADVVSFDNPLQGRDSTNTVYLGRKPR